MGRHPPYGGKTNMDEEKKDIVVENEDAELDKSLEDSLNAMKAGNAPEVTPQVKVEESTDSKTEEPSKPQEDAPKETYEFRVPNKGKFESDESYEKRIELLDLVKQRKLAKSPEQIQKLSEQIQTTKKQIGTLNGSDKINSTLNKSVVESKTEEEDEVLKSDRERLKQLGGATKDDIQEMLKQERFEVEQKSTLQNFIDRHPEFKDDDVREVFFEFTENNFNVTGKAGKDLMTVLELAREAMFKPSETIQERVLKGADVQQKINAMQFPGGSIAKGDFSPEMRKSIDELKSTGMSEEKAIELLSD